MSSTPENHLQPDDQRPENQRPEDQQGGNQRPENQAAGSTAAREGVDPTWQPPQAPGAAALPDPYRHPAPPAPAERRGGWFRKGFGLGAGGALGAGSVLLGLSLVGSLLGGLVLAGVASSIGEVGTSADTVPLETVWGPDDAASTLRAIDVKGAIMAGRGDGLTMDASTYGYEVADMIDKLGKDDAAGLVLVMDTPGGSINGSRAIGDAVDRYQERTGHKVLAHVEGMSASGGMFAMAPADRIVADHGTLVGSIGVISGPFQQYKGVVATEGGLLGGGVTTTGGITSEYLTQGKGKDFGNPYRAMTAEERAVWTKGLANEYAEFVDWVSTHRRIPAATIRDDLGAHLFDARTAKQKKLVDEVMSRDEAFKEAARINGVDPASTRVQAATTPGMLASLLGAESRVYGKGAAAGSVDGQPARATSVLCQGSPQVLALQGGPLQLCGR